MRFLIDMPLSPQLAAWLSSRGHEAIHASAMGLAQAPDTQILETARREDRVIITADLDYPRLLALTRAHTPGVILFRGGKFSEDQAMANLSRVFEAVDSDSILKSLIVVEPDRIRRRNLPLV